ncbi:type IX secretion/gliding motility protein PorT/SprT [Wenyingzhuangia sp. IMCC45533]
MKLKVIILLLIVCSLTNSYGQRKKILQLNNFDKSLRYGYYLGLHNRGYELRENSSAKVSQGYGFQLGVLADLNLSEHFSIITEPGVVSTSNAIVFIDDGEEFDMSTTHFHLPISIKLKTERVNNVRAFVQAGASYNYNFSSDKNKGDNGADPNDFLLTKHNFWGEISIGANFYFPYFKFSPSFKGVYGFNNEFEGLGNNAKENVSSLKSRGVFLTLTFQ